MIECEKCGKFFKPDDIESCPECGMELCPTCYEEHVTKCTLQMDDDLNAEETSIPHKCPLCGSDLEPTVEMDGSMGVQCEKCDYYKEFNEEQINEVTSFETSKNKKYDKAGNYIGRDAFTCPDCGRTFAPDDYENGDAGNGFCRECAPEH